MPPLPSDLRKTLENTIVAARDTAEAAARAVLTTLAVERPEPFATMKEDQKSLRRALRAKARQLGGGDQPAGIPLLVEEIAYQQWHRMLFARFLAENNLLMHPQGVPVTLAECAELAPEEGAADAWELAARYASAMLPGIFLAGDPAVQVRFAPESRHALEKLVGDLPPAVFTADDGLGWVYQFWQSKRKDEVNRSERKIGGADIGPVTQLFTEDYMVKFLLENTLGAWWAARHPDSPLIKEWQYLRWMEPNPPAPFPGREGVDEAPPSPVATGDEAHPSPVATGEGWGGGRTPAAGTFPGWPDRAAQVTMMDPCGGSGHFVVAEFDMLRRMRMEEGLPEAAAADAVIRDNIFMLEIDPRCTQIAAFNLALAAWKVGDPRQGTGGYRPLPTPNIACSGIAVAGQLADWLRLAGGDPSTGSGRGERLQTALERLWKLFRDAPTLGSLINPADVPLNERMFTAEYEEVAPLLEKALAQERDDPAAAVLGAAAEGVAKAAKLLAGQYTLVATNVPYLTSVKQDEALRAFCSKHYPQAKADLATAFVQRCGTLATENGCAALVVPQNWFFLGSYAALRRRLLQTKSWNVVAQLGPGAFETIGGHVVNVVLILLSNTCPDLTHVICGIDATMAGDVPSKVMWLRSATLSAVAQSQQFRNPDCRIVLEQMQSSHLLSEYADSYWGLGSGDYPRYGRCFWELASLGRDWIFQQSTVETTLPYGGREHILYWQEGKGDLVHDPGAYIRATHIWGKKGVLVSQIGDLPVTLYTGEAFDTNCSPIIPKTPSHLAAIWAFCNSIEFARAVRRIDKKMNVTNATLVKVPFDLDHWHQVADSAGPLPEPHSDDPTQWLFSGHPVGASEPLQVVVARLLGYRWPWQKPDNLDPYVDTDGLVCLPAVAGEQPASERLRALLAAAYGDDWSVGVQQKLLADAGFKDKGLDDWLRDGFFEQHCRRFHNRPFIWHIWDGRRDGFSALVNYHKLNAANLDKLIYTYLGNWIETQRAERDRGLAAADGRLVAALELKKKLELIREGEGSPNGKSGYDIYVRWKPLHDQPIGWDPDLNDGVRLNIRPFVAAGVLRSRFSIHWNKDRGKNPDGSERINEKHLTRAEKLAARKAAAN